MPSGRIYTSEERKRIYELLQERKSYSEISRKLELSRNGVADHVWKYGGKNGYFGHEIDPTTHISYYSFEDKLTLEQVKEIRESLKMGQSIAEISRSLSYSRNSLGDHIRRYGGRDHYSYVHKDEVKEKSNVSNKKIKSLEERVSDLENQIEILNSFLKEKYA